MKFHSFSCDENTQKLKAKELIGEAKDKQNDKCIMFVVERGEEMFAWTDV